METGSDRECLRVDQEVDRHLAAGALTCRSREFQRHLETCPRCDALYGRRNDTAPRIPGGLEDRIVAELQGSLNCVAPLSSSPVIAVQVIALFLLIVAGMVSRVPWAGMEVMTTAQRIGMSAAYWLALCWLAVWLAHEMRPGSRRRISPGVSFALAALGLISALVFLFPWRAPEAFWSRGVRCLGAGMAMAAPAALAFSLLARRGSPLNLTFMGGIVGSLGGLAGMTVLQLTCERQDRIHLPVWHGAVLLLATALGALSGGLWRRDAALFRSNLR